MPVMTVRSRRPRITRATRTAGAARTLSVATILLRLLTQREQSQLELLPDHVGLVGDL